MPTPLSKMRPIGVYRPRCNLIAFSIRFCLRRLLCLLLLVVTGVAMAASFDITFRIPEKVEIALSTGAVDLGSPFSVGSDYVYFEKPGALRVDFRCNRLNEWEVRLSGVDFRAGKNTIPISRLEWKANQGGAYTYMPPEGEYAVLDSSRNHPKKSGRWQKKDISYRLKLTGDEYEGTYNSIITYTLFLP